MGTLINRPVYMEQLISFREKESIRKKLRDMEAEAKRRNDVRRQQTRPRATIMTEDAKTEENTAGSPCGAYIG